MSDILSQSIAQRLTGSVNTAFITQNNLPLVSTVLNSVIPSISLGVARDSTKIVNKEANFTLNEIPKNLVGQNNPVDIVSSNLSATELNSTLRDNIDSGVSNDINASIANRVDEALVLNLPGGSNNPDLNLIKNNIINALQGDVSRIIGSAINSFSSGVFDRNVEVKPIVRSIDNFFTGNDPNLALEKYDNEYNNALVSEALSDSIKFDPINDDNLEKLRATKVGFLDPTGTFPTQEYANRVDTNKLATGDVNGTIVQTKNNDRMIGAKLPGGTSWSQPESPFKAEYPYNKVTQTEQGHIIEIDDTPGAERLHIYHKSGTFVEIDSNGSIVKRTKGSNYEIIDRNGYIAIAGKADISINGACNIFVGNDANIEVEGDTNIICHNDITAQAGGTLNLSAVESINLRSANVFIEADNELHLLSDSEMKLNANVLHSNATTEMYVYTTNYFGKFEENHYDEILGDKHYKLTNDFYLQTDNFYGKVATQSFLESGSDIHLLSTGDVNIDGNEIHLNDNAAQTSQDALESVQAVGAENAAVGLLTGRKDIYSIDINDPQVLTKADGYAITAEETSTTQQEVQEAKNKAVRDGIISRKDFEENPIVVDSESPRSLNNTFVTPSAEILKLNIAPDNFNLSPNFTLAMLSSKAAVSKHRLESQAGKTYGELLFNLSCIALNICEPVLKLYPNMYVTSALRPVGNNKNSQHPLGQAVDIQFKGISKKEYYNIAKVLSEKLNYDQLLLEYASTTNNPWIHISLDPAKNNRTQIMTFNNHAKFADGLSQLA